MKLQQLKVGRNVALTRKHVNNCTKYKVSASLIVVLTSQRVIILLLSAGGAGPNVALTCKNMNN